MNDASPREGWAAGRGIRLHFLSWGDESGAAGNEIACASPRLVIVPGTFGMAEDYVPEMRALAPRRVTAMSLRGRGRSDAPEQGYTFANHVDDIAAVVDQLGGARSTSPASARALSLVEPRVVPRFVLMGYSMGAAYALGYALCQPKRVAGLIVGDYPARYPALGTAWPERALAIMPERAKAHVAYALQRDSTEVLLWDRLGEIRCPVLVLRGGKEGARVTDEHAARYRRVLARVEVASLPESGHEIWEPDFALYVATIARFVDELSASEP